MHSYSENIKVSVVIITYNHVPYIKDTLEGALNQNTNFKYEILIHDDASTDGTTEIVREYEQRYPDKIIAFYEKENIYSRSGDVTREICKHARGIYMAFCEGDDYWTDENKLQIQYDFMESHPDYSICVHNTQVLNIKTGKISLDTKHKTGELPQGYVIENAGRCFHTSSWFYRNNHDDTIGGDAPRVCYLADSGKIMYFDKCMSLYRMYTKGSWSESMDDKFTLMKDYLLRLSFYEKFDKETKYRWHENVANICTKIEFQIFHNMRPFYRTFKFRYRLQLLLTICVDCFGLYPLRQYIKKKTGI